MTAEIVDLASFRAARAKATGPLLAKSPRSGAPGMITLMTREESRWADHRDEPRHRMDGACGLSLQLGGRQASLENVSRNGLMVRADLPEHPGMRVVISVGGCHDVTGRVIWKRDGMVGLEVPIGALALA